MRILIKGGHVIDPSQGIDKHCDILVENRKIKKIYAKGKAVEDPKDKVIDARGLYVLPGLVDMHIHLREPGFEHKESIQTGTHAAIHGGFTSVCAMPNTNPVNDNPGITEYIQNKSNEEGVCTVYPIGAITKGQRSEELAEMGLMLEEGCVAFSDDGKPVMNALLMRRALEYSKAFGFPIIAHCEDMELAKGGVMNEGAMSFSLGLRGIPHTAEETITFRDVALAELTGGRLHVAHVSTEGSVRIVRDAKSRGVKVTAETCPHYFSITDEAVAGFNTAAKVNPPLRTKRDIEAIKEGISDGTLDAIATDHAPHHRNEKQLEFDMAPFGISGLETALALSLNLVRDGVITLNQLVDKMSCTPARILGLPKGSLSEGADADIVIIDMDKSWTVDCEAFFSKGKNTPFEGWQMRGAALYTISMGKVYEWR